MEEDITLIILSVSRSGALPPSFFRRSRLCTCVFRNSSALAFLPSNARSAAMSIEHCIAMDRSLATSTRSTFSLSISSCRRVVAHFEVDTKV